MNKWFPNHDGRAIKGLQKACEESKAKGSLGGVLLGQVRIK